MARIKGTYTSKRPGISYQRCTGEVRYLDVVKGTTYREEDGVIAAGYGFELQADGTYANSTYTFTPDQLLTCDWYVIRQGPLGADSMQCEGPFVENVARTKAVGAVKTHRGPDCSVSVVQLKQGDTYSKVTPAPEPTYSWS